MAESNISKQPLRAQVRDYMSLGPQTLEVNQTLLDAVLLLRSGGLRHIPILEEGRLVGILTDRDVSRVAPTLLLPLPQQEYNRLFETTLVGKVMTRNPISITPEAPLEEAVELLYNNRVGCLPVLENGRLIGIITRADILRALHDLISNP